MSPQRGARVADVSLEEARELYELRIQLEPQALRSSVENSDPSYVDDVKAAYKAFVAVRKRPRSNPPTAPELYGHHRAASSQDRCHRHATVGEAQTHRSPRQTDTDSWAGLQHCLDEPSHET